MKDRIENGSFKIENSQIWLINKTRTEGSCSGLFSQIFSDFFIWLAGSNLCVTAFIQGFLTVGSGSLMERKDLWGSRETPGSKEMHQLRAIGKILGPSHSSSVNKRMGLIYSTSQATTPLWGPGEQPPSWEEYFFTGIA